MDSAFAAQRSLLALLYDTSSVAAAAQEALNQIMFMNQEILSASVDTDSIVVIAGMNVVVFSIRLNQRKL